ncbi:MAG: FAD-linked oxidase C-terminal domain-containing protein [Xanthobacteraceae bacterium]
MIAEGVSRIYAAIERARSLQHHRTWYDRERPQPFADALKAVKQQLDPHHILNPGILID